uniref:DH domain-containing protein n=1 Tax=Ditylenchus dipsaci TaxID=166011 RepID=A0A915CVZ6_9BILA
MLRNVPQAMPVALFFFKNSNQPSDTGSLVAEMCRCNVRFSDVIVGAEFDELYKLLGGEGAISVVAQLSVENDFLLDSMLRNIEGFKRIILMVTSAEHTQRVDLKQFLLQSIMENQHKVDFEANHASTSNMISPIYSNYSSFKKPCVVYDPTSELMNTENTFIHRLEICINVYLRSLRSDECPSDLIKKETLIFGNIEQIYNFHTNILSEELKHAKTLSEIVRCFTNNTVQIKQLYSIYLENKQTNNSLIFLPDSLEWFSRVRREHNLEQCHDLPSMLILPLQRITRYQLLFKEILENCCQKETDDVTKALDLVTSIPKLANDKAHLNKLLDNSGPILKMAITNQLNSFFMQDDFMVTIFENHSKRDRLYKVFLFEDILLLVRLHKLPHKTRKLKLGDYHLLKNDNNKSQLSFSFTSQ